MPTQTYTINTANAFAGMQSNTTASVVQTMIATVETEYGECVRPADAAGLLEDDRNVRLGADSGVVHAIALRELNHEAVARPSPDGRAVYNPTDSMSTVREGYVYVTTVAACTAFQRMFAHPTLGTISGTSAGGHVATVNLVAQEAAAAGAIVEVRLDIVAPAASL